MVSIGGHELSLGSLSGIWDVLGLVGIGIVIIAAVGLFAWWYLEKSKYNKTVQVKRLYSGNAGKYFFDKAKLMIDGDGVEWWQLKGLQRKVTVPPEESLGIGVKGGTIGFGVLDSNGQFTWVSHDFDFEAFKKDEENFQTVEVDNPEKPGEKMKVEKQVKAFKASYEPISTESKANWAYQHRKNQKLRAGNWLKENGAVLVTGMTLIFLVLGVMILSPKVIKANVELGEQNVKTARAQAEAAKQMDEVLISVNRLLEQQVDFEAQRLAGSGEELEAPS